MMLGGYYKVFFMAAMWPAAIVAQGSLPYIPTHIIATENTSSSNDLIYILQPNSDQSAVRLLSLSLSTAINTSNPQFAILQDQVPFFANDSTFVPMMNSNGSVTVFTGSCRPSQDSSTPRLWSLVSDQNSPTGNGTWKSSALNTSSTSTSTTGPGYLARGFAYLFANNTAAEYYTFGGMCPFANATLSDWTSRANYSNDMIELTLQNSTSNSTSLYTMQHGTLLNSPIPEAGYTVTPLPKTSSTTSGGRVVQQESFLFIGGHTQTAFLNMSTLALYSLPQASWSYFSVGTRLDVSKTDLAVRSTSPNIEPRSGHSTVLSSDGSKIIVFGGWVGDTSTPADPQLAILDVGEDYGGQGQWAWSSPTPMGKGPSSGSGIFGHATTMLPGDVMMVSGGYVIPSSTDTTSKRASTAGLEASSQIYLYNLTSNSWISSYTAPAPSTSTADHSSSGRLKTSAEKAGVGVGVSVGAIAVICLIYLLWSRKRYKYRRKRDQQLRKLALGAERSNIWGEPGIESSYRGPSEAAIRNSILENVYLSGPSHQYSAVPVPNHNIGNENAVERSGALYEVPSPSRGLRRSLSGRPQRVQSAGWYEENRTRYGPGFIHPIDEREEFETPPEEVAERSRPESGSSDSDAHRLSDPFRDPSLSPTREPLMAFYENSTRQQENSDRASILSNKSRSLSPDKSERTRSDLSESSRSETSELSIQRSNIGSQRRSANLYQTPFPTFAPSNHHDAGRSGRSSPEKNAQQSAGPDAENRTRWPFERSGTIDSFSTSVSRHRQSPLEGGDTLLGLGPEWCTPPESPARLSDRESRPSSNQSSLTWVGSIRKALSNAARRVALGQTVNNAAEDRASPAMFEFNSPVDFDDTNDDDEGISPEETARASSASAVAQHHQRRIQGPKDWAVDEATTRLSVGGISSLSSNPSPRRSRHLNEFDDHEGNEQQPQQQGGGFHDSLHPDDRVDDHRSASSIGGTDEGDWDVELAAEGRLVQITYTIPKERLRVVNAGAGDRVIGDDVSEIVSRTSQEKQ